MSWKTTNAHLEKQQLIREWEGGDHGVAELARRFGVSRKTAYKWLERYELEGQEGLEERSRAPEHHPNALAEEIVALVLECKMRWPSFGAPKLWRKLWQRLGAERCPAESSISRILHQHGMTRPRGRRRWRGAGSGGGSTYGGNNAVWCTDFKGWFRTGAGEVCTPLTISDGYSRYLLRCQGLQGATGSAVVRAIFEATMREYGVPVVIHSDNGAPFASSGVGGLTDLAVWWLRVGIRLERSRPGCPQDNGRHERLHRTLQEATAEPPAATRRGQQRAFDAFREEYNQERPHEGLGGQTPAEVYHPSPRNFPERLPRYPEYPAHWLTRNVRGGGQMTWQGADVMITKVLAGQQVGLEPVSDGVWRVHFAAQELGLFDERKKQLVPIPKTKRPAAQSVPPEAPAA